MDGPFWHALRLINILCLVLVHIKQLFENKQKLKPLIFSINYCSQVIMQMLVLILKVNDVSNLRFSHRLSVRVNTDGIRKPMSDWSLPMRSLSNISGLRELNRLLFDCVSIFNLIWAVTLFLNWKNLLIHWKNSESNNYRLKR